MDDTLRVLVVDDHPGVRLGIASLIQAEAPRMQAIAAVGTPAEALLETAKQRPHVIVLDVNLAGEDGLALIPALMRIAPCAVVVLTSLVDPRVAQRAQILGAYACVHKTAPAHELMASIRSAQSAQAVTGGPADAGGAMSRHTGTNHP